MIVYPLLAEGAIFVFTGADVVKPGAAAGIFKYPTYVQDIMGFVLLRLH